MVETLYSACEWSVVKEVDRGEESSGSEND